GSPSPDSVVFHVSGELPTSLSIVLQGTSSNPNGFVFGDGVRCVAGTMKRLYVKNASGGAFSAPGAGDPSVPAPSPAPGDPIAPGSTRYYQSYYRDANASFCPNPPGDTFNVTNALYVIW